MLKCPSCNSPFSPGTKLCRSCGASIPELATATNDLEKEVRSLLDQGKKIEAIKVFRSHTGSSLKDAKDAVEDIQRGATLSRPDETDPDLEKEVRSLLDQGKKIEAIKVFRSHTGSSLKDAKDAVENLQRGASLPRPREADADADVETDVLRLLKQGEKLKAVKLYKDRTGASLLDSKGEVELIAARQGVTAARQGVTSKGGGCSSVLAMFLVALFAVVVMPVLMMLRQ